MCLQNTLTHVSVQVSPCVCKYSTHVYIAARSSLELSLFTSLMIIIFCMYAMLHTGHAQSVIHYYCVQRVLPLMLCCV